MNSSINSAAGPMGNVSNSMNSTNAINTDMAGGKRKKKSTKGGKLPVKKIKEKVHRGPRGGKYLMKNGVKVYL